MAVVPSLSFYDILDRYVNIKSLIWTSIILATVRYLAVKVYRMFIYPYYVSPLRHLPGPKDGHFLLGQTYNILKSKPAEPQLSWMRQFPDAPLIRYLSLGNTEALLVNSCQAFKDVLQTNCYAFVKPAVMQRVVGEIVGKGLVFAEGEDHKKQRRLLTGPFSFGNIKNLLPHFHMKGEELCAVITSKAGSDQASTVEFTEVLSKATLDIIGLSALGYKLESLSSYSRFAEAYRTIFEFPALGLLIAFINQYVSIRPWLPLKVNRDFVQANEDIRTLVRIHIRERKKQVLRPDDFAKDNNGNKRDLLTLMVEEKSGGPDPWTETEILDHLLNFMAAGHETTAGALNWALHILTKHPGFQDRLRKEIENSIPASRKPTYEEIESMKYLDNVTREVLRYYPPSISVPREASRDIIISGVVVPKGTAVFIVPAVANFNKTVWGPTADEFDPDRWDNLPETARDPFAFQSFIAGPRACIGKHFAMLEIKALLIELVKNFRFEATSSKVEVQRQMMTLRPDGGLRLRVTPLE